MPEHFDLVITADYPNRIADLHLLDAHRSQLAFRQTDFKTITVSRLRGLFDLRNYLRHYVESGQEQAAVADIGVCIATEVLGADIFGKLAASKAQRTLRIQLPSAIDTENHLAAALARVPWEIARSAANQPTLAERNLLVRVVHDMAAPTTLPLDLEGDECLRVLFVFAEARGSRPLASRIERLELLRLFEREIYPQRRIVAHFLTHGVTRARLKSQITDQGGYHVVHWSGHGHLNLLELAKPGGAHDYLSGEELLDLFTEAGGFIPRLVFLSACHSGDILRVKDWDDFLAAAQGHEPSAKDTPSSQTKDVSLDEGHPGYTGTAHALLRGGVPSVIAMRFAVGDGYARELGVEFYRALLVHAQPKTVAAALTMARQSVRDQSKHDSAEYAICDHATPVLYGAEHPGLALRKGRSPGLDTRNRRLHRIAELTLAAHEHFVGRSWDLAGLGADFIGSTAGVEVKPIAVITGLGGMGKTALTAEALALWESRFEWVLLYQAKPNALGFDTTLRDIHTKLDAELGRYHDHVDVRPADAIHRATDSEFTGPERLERLTRNLVRALRDEPILLVLDNFENNLKPQAEATVDPVEPAWACQDPAWDRCLAMLATELVGTPSRVLITCRRPLATLVGTPCYRVLLGPLAARDAALYLREHPGLSKMLFSGDAAEKTLAMRLLNASRFYPLLMDRLARLATGGPTLRPQLMQALDTLEKSNEYRELPALFATGTEDAKELVYLNEALDTSLNRLIEHASSDARHLLWTIALANDPVDLTLLESVWSREETQEQRQLQQIKQMMDRLPTLPPELQERFNSMPLELRAQLDALPPRAPARPDLTPLLRSLVAVGLVTDERAGSDDVNPEFTCHELVRERIRAWMRDHPQGRGEMTENAIRLDYAERLTVAFAALREENLTAALQAGIRGLVYCVQAGAYERLGRFAVDIVTSIRDLPILADLVPHLEYAANAAPEGRSRSLCLLALADALRRIGRSDASLPFYEQAYTLARTAAEAARGTAAAEAWADVAIVTGNWANALRRVGDLGASTQRHRDSAAAERRAGRPAVYVIISELEALRNVIIQGRSAEALPDVEERVTQVVAWWNQHQSGQPVREAPDAVFLVRALISALDIAMAAYMERKDWEPALGCVDAILEVKRAHNFPAHDIARHRSNRATVLRATGRFNEAQAELEGCLELFRDDPGNKALVFQSLAQLFAAQDDMPQAVTQSRRGLSLHEQSPDPRERALSHESLAFMLHNSGTLAAVAESQRHRLAALIYRLASGLEVRESLLQFYVADFQRVKAADTAQSVPPVTDLVADPAFRSLDGWLRHRGVGVADVQAAVNKFLDEARQAAERQQ